MIKMQLDKGLISPKILPPQILKIFIAVVPTNWFALLHELLFSSKMLRKMLSKMSPFCR